MMKDVEFIYLFAGIGIGAVIGGILFWALLSSRSQYSKMKEHGWSNQEVTEIKRNQEGLIEKFVVHRDVRPKKKGDWVRSYG